MNPATRSHVRHAGDVPAEVLAERQARAERRQTELATEMAAFRAENPEMAARMDRRERRRFR